MGSDVRSGGIQAANEIVEVWRTEAMGSDISIATD